MPCYDGPQTGDWNHFPTYEKMKLRLDLTTRLACEYCIDLEMEGFDVPEYAQQWWKEHQIIDKERKGE